MTSSVEDGRIPNKPAVLCHEFYTKKIATKAQAFLNKTLAAAGCIASVNSGCILALFSGSFVRDVADIPANFSIFLVPVAQPNTASLRTQSMMLQFKVSHGQGWPEKDFKDAAKQGIQAPNLADNLVYQIDNNVKLSLFFFGDESVLTANLRRLHQSIRAHIITFFTAKLHLTSLPPHFLTQSTRKRSAGLRCSAALQTAAKWTTP